MRDYVIITDSACDLPGSLAEQWKITAVPLSVCIDGKSYYNYLDGRDIKPDYFFQQLREGKKSTTSGCSTGQFEEVMERFLKQGKDILYMGVYSILSTTYNSGYLAAENLRSKYPEARIETIDTDSVSMGQGLLVYLAAQQKQKGRSIDEVLQFVIENKRKILHWFMLDDVGFMKRGGRLDKESGNQEDILNLKSIIYIDSEGHVKKVEKARSRKAAFRSLVDKIKERINHAAEKQTICISHGDCEEDAQLLAQMIQEIKPDSHCIINYCGPVNGNHTGPGMIGLFFMAEEER